MMSTNQQRPWLRRNLKWIIPLGCLLPFLVVGGIVTFVLVVVFGVIKSAEPYRESIARAEKNPAVVQALGEPLKPGMIPSGNISVSGSSGDAEFSIPISGPKGSAVIYVVAKKKAGKWIYEILEVEVEGSKDRIDLLEHSVQPDKPPQDPGSTSVCEPILDTAA